MKYCENDVVHTREQLEEFINNRKAVVVVSASLLKQLMVLASTLPAITFYSKVPNVFVFFPKNTLKHYGWKFDKINDENPVMILSLNKS